MSSKVLTLYDVTGIQSFIYSTNKLKENLGSSIIVQEILETKLVEIIKNHEESTHYFINSEDTSFNINDNNSDIIVVYIAGGNAFIIFKSKPLAKEITKKLSEKLLLETGGLLSISVAYLKTDFQKGFIKDHSDLEIKINENKLQFIRTMPLLGIGITKQELSTGLPTQIIDNNEYISYPSYSKRINSKKDTYEKDYLGDYSESYRFPKKIDELCQKSGDNYIAVVHIDGNNIGQLRKSILQDITDYSKTLIRLNEFSCKIRKLFKDAMKLTIKNLIGTLNNSDIKDDFDCNKVDKRKNLPIRPLILKGDDITFICNGKLGIGLTEDFFINLKNLQETPDFKINNHSMGLTASGGVLIVKTKFPFFRAYELTEELCRSAKIKGKLITTLENGIPEKGFSFTKGYWLDFEICHSNMSMNLNDLRLHQYNITGQDAPKPLRTKVYGATILEMPRYNLLWRPWCFNDGSNSKYNWSKLKSLISGFKITENKWTRTKIVNFKKLFYSSKEHINQFLLELPKNQITLPEFMSSNRIWYDNDDRTPYFDALNIMDYYIQIIRNEGVNNS